jgi:hypothetical protein
VMHIGIPLTGVVDSDELSFSVFNPDSKFLTRDLP